MRVLAGLDLAITMLDQPDVLSEVLGHLQEQHASRHITDEYYKVPYTALRTLTLRRIPRDQLVTRSRDEVESLS